MVTKHTVDHGKLEALTKLLIAASSGDGSYDDAKLGWLLFQCDFTSYARAGKALTDAEYIKTPSGPRPRILGEQQRESAPNVDFEPAERVLVNAVLAANDGLSSGKIASSRLPHTLGWHVANDGDVIPYESALLSSDASDADVAWGSDVAKRHGA